MFSAAGKESVMEEKWGRITQNRAKKYTLSTTYTIQQQKTARTLGGGGRVGIADGRQERLQALVHRARLARALLDKALSGCGKRCVKRVSQRSTAIRNAHSCQRDPSGRACACPRTRCRAARAPRAPPSGAKAPWRRRGTARAPPSNRSPPCRIGPKCVIEHFCRRKEKKRTSLR